MAFVQVKSGGVAIRENWSHGHRDRVLLKMELELKHLKLNPVTVIVTPVFPGP